MKAFSKVLALVMALTMLMSCGALAEGAKNPEDYTG